VPPVVGVGGAVAARDHGVSDPGTRARSGPAPVRRGRSRHCCEVVGTQHVQRREAPRVCRIERARLRVRSSGQSGPVCPGKCCPQTRSHSARACRPVVVLEMVLGRVAFDVHCDHREVITSGATSTPPALTTTMLHLCSAPCKALRFAPPARTRGLRALDGACAQMIGGHLRDGRRMLLPSGTNGALIDPSNGLEKRSCMFDRFRTRAFRPLVEVHFSRFCPLTSVASGASLFAFDRCCDAPSSALGHRRGAAVDRRPQGLNQQLPCDEQGNDRRCACRSSVAEASLNARFGDREDSTTNYNVQVERFDSHRSLNRCEKPSGSAPRSSMSVSGPHQRF
jgi:hypothetical protein